MKSGQLWIVQLAEGISSKVYRLVLGWTGFDKRHLGDQLVRSVDSIGANIVEGYARHHSKDRMRFYSMARGSIEESMLWIRKAEDRKLISKGEAISLLGSLGLLSGSFSKFIGNQKLPENDSVAETPNIGNTQRQ